MVCGDPRVRELLEKCIPTADDPGRYRAVEPERQRKLEYQLATSSMTQTGWRPWTDPCQGMYVLTPSGKLLAGGNNPFNPESARNDLRKGLEAYAKMPRAERLLSRPPDPKEDGIHPGRVRPRPPAGGLVLQVVSRGLEEGAGGRFDGPRFDLSREFYHVDRLWYTREEAAQFLPDTLKPGQRKEVTGPVINGLAQLYLILQQSHWDRGDVKELRLTAEVAEVTGPTVRLTLTGRAVLDADGRFNRGKYRPDLLGHLTYDTARRTFTRFELLAYGVFDRGPGWRKVGGSDSVPVGFLFRLNGSDANDEQPPTKLDRYPFVKLASGR